MAPIATTTPSSTRTTAKEAPRRAPSRNRRTNAMVPPSPRRMSPDCPFGGFRPLLSELTPLSRAVTLVGTIEDRAERTAAGESPVTAGAPKEQILPGNLSGPRYRRMAGASGKPGRHGPAPTVQTAGSTAAKLSGTHDRAGRPPL